MFPLVESLLDHEMLNNPTVRWGIAAGVVALVASILAIVKRFAVGRLRSLSDHRPLSTLEYVAQVVDRTSLLLYLSLGGWMALTVLRLSEPTAQAASKVFTVLLFLQIGLWGAEGVEVAIQRYRDQPEFEQDAGRTTGLSAVAFLGKLLVWLAIFVLVIDNLGFDITALIASLGIGGIAVALAVQNILGDLFASLSIIVDKPFVHGDFIIVGEYMGTVEKIGLKTTRIRSLGGEQLIFSNQDLLQSRIRNYRRMEERRVVFELGVTYQTASDHVREIPEMVRQIIEETDDVRFDRAHFNTFGDSSLKYEIVYWVLSPDYNVYMDIHQSIIFRLLERFREEGIEIAYPTQTVHVERGDGGPETSLAPAEAP